MKEETRLRGQLRWLVHGARGAIIRDVHRLMRGLHASWPDVPEQELLASAQLTGLRTAAAWHERRRTATARLRALDAELLRLARRAARDPQRLSFYTGLRHTLGAEHTDAWRTLEEMPAPSTSRWERVLNQLEPPDDAREVWGSEVRLAVATATLDALLALYETRALQHELNQATAGGLRWP